MLSKLLKYFRKPNIIRVVDPLEDFPGKDLAFPTEFARIVGGISMIDQEFEKECDVVTLIKVDYTSIEGLIDRHFKNEKHKEGYSLPCIDEKGNDEDWEIDIMPEEIEEGSYDYDKLQKIEAGKWPQYSTQTLLNHLCAKGVIKSGHYLISVSW